MDPRQSKSRRGQTLAEFALTLPILLMLMFGVIEFARIFQAWITLQNAARSAARFAITGQWDEDSVVELYQKAGYTAPGTWTKGKDNDEPVKGEILDDLVPCTIGMDEVFYNHWGHDCEPGDDDDQGLREDILRIPGIVNRARIGAAGLSLKDGESYVGLSYGGAAINTETVGEDQPGWFHVWICSSRPPLSNSKIGARYKPSENRDERHCGLQEGPGVPDPLPSDYAGDNQYDAGGPGDAVEVIVFFNHPLITPLGLVDYVQLQARRVMINESFRSTRVVNLPPQLAQPTFTPSKTPLPSNTPLPSDTPLPTGTFTRTASPLPSSTSSPTPPPDCSLITLVSARLVDNYLMMTVRNANTYAPVFLVESYVAWTANSTWANMYVSEGRIYGHSPYWSGNSKSPAIARDGSAGWISDPPDFLTTRVDANGDTVFQFRFLNGPTRMTDYFTLSNFWSTTLTLGTGWGGSSGTSPDCEVSLEIYPSPTPPSQSPTRTPTPVCNNYVVSWIGFETNAVVHFRITNQDVVVGQLTGFTINWNTYNRSLPAIQLDFVSVGGTNAFDPATVIIWDGKYVAPDVTDKTSPLTAAQGSTYWVNTPSIGPGQSADIWLDFDGTSQRLDSQFGYFQSDFNATSFTFNFNCARNNPDVNTPVNTAPPTATYTPGPTKTKTPVTPSNTPGPTKTKTPVTPSKTPTKTKTSPPQTNTVPPPTSGGLE
ncbi:MAG TPA: TadE/TadG family type IV pilus assembly protein [Aggregatilineaceae bacterium]|nr:TadE/TadG family type IV pilus assembly protein [Aggregatilineaceae bacterium]